MEKIRELVRPTQQGHSYDNFLARALEGTNDCLANGNYDCFFQRLKSLVYHIPERYAKEYQEKIREIEQEIKEKAQEIWQTSSSELEAKKRIMQMRAEIIDEKALPLLTKLLDSKFILTRLIGIRVRPVYDIDTEEEE